MNQQAPAFTVSASSFVCLDANGQDASTESVHQVPCQSREAVHAHEFNMLFTGKRKNRIAHRCVFHSHRERHARPDPRMRRSNPRAINALAPSRVQCGRLAPGGWKMSRWVNVDLGGMLGLRSMGCDNDLGPSFSMQRPTRSNEAAEGSERGATADPSDPGAAPSAISPP